MMEYLVFEPFEHNVLSNIVEHILRKVSSRNSGELSSMRMSLLGLNYGKASEIVLTLNW